jgi:hypothetical protein
VTLTFVEASVFTSSVHEYFGSDDAYATFQEFLLADPDRGNVITGCGGLRKVRWPDPRRSMGKRGGLRIIYLHVPEVRYVLLLDIYGNENDDLSNVERKELAHLADEYRREILETTHNKKGSNHGKHTT